jgi:hypothetical protein
MRVDIASYVYGQLPTLADLPLNKSTSNHLQEPTVVGKLVWFNDEYKNNKNRHFNPLCITGYIACNDCF